MPAPTAKDVLETVKSNLFFSLLFSPYSEIVSKLSSSILWPVVCKRIISQLQYSVLACARNSTSPRVQLRCWWNDAPVPWRRRHPRTARWICTKSITVVLLTSRPWNCGKN